MSKKVSFEKNLEELEKLVEQMESGKLSLEESINNFEKSVKLYQQCKESLDSAEKKIKVLTEELKEEDY
ncbi:MAG: exodeoxyribonuclease VII small subunit [Halobacteriovoraceae bacterium]|nr:exodeoxyribonuclease VII small subunit [Halobacteriovoraceae bacterium]